MRRNMDVPTMARRTTFACVSRSAGQFFAKHTNKLCTAASRSATPATRSSPGLIRENSISTPTVTTTPIADARQRHSDANHDREGGTGTEVLDGADRVKSQKK